MTDETPTPVDPARVHAVLEVLGWPDDRKTAAADQEPLDAADLPFVHLYWELAEDIIRAADAAKPERHVIEFHPHGYHLMHPLSCGPLPSACPVWLAAEQDAGKFEALAGSSPYLGQFECAVNDLGDGLLILPRVDPPGDAR